MAVAQPPGRREVQATFDVRVFETRKKQRQKGVVYEVRWQVDGRGKGRTFPTRALADSFRSTLISATRQGQPFDRATGAPLSALPAVPQTSWWSWMLTYVDLKWPTLAPSSRRSMAEALLAATLLLYSTDRGHPSRAEVQRALNGWALNAPRRAAGPPSPEIAETVKWLEKNTVPLSDLDDPSGSESSWTGWPSGSTARRRPQPRLPASGP